jgi:hypothetical protein
MLIYHSISDIERAESIRTFGFSDADYSARGLPWVWTAERPRIGCDGFQQDRNVCFQIFVADATALAGYLHNNPRRSCKVWILPAHVANRFPRRLLSAGEVSDCVQAWRAARRPATLLPVPSLPLSQRGPR